MEEKFVLKTIIEIVGSPKEHVEETLQMVEKKMGEREKTKVREYKSFPAEPMEGKPLFTAFCEAEVEFKDMEDIVGFCFDFMPSSVEVLHPSELKMTGPQINSFLNDLLARLHQYDMVLKNIHAQNLLYKKELDKLDQNKEEKKD